MSKWISVISTHVSEITEISNLGNSVFRNDFGVLFPLIFRIPEFHALEENAPGGRN